MIHTCLLLLSILQLTDPVEVALRASEAPKSVRVAFEVELRSDEAVRIFAYDPRLEGDRKWQLEHAWGEDGYLDEIGAAWGAEEAPDGRLFPDDLRASLGADFRVEDLGAAWRLHYQHTPSANDGSFDVWAAEQLEATAWISPENGRFLRIDYELPAPVNGPEGGRLLSYDQSYFLEADPVFELSLITSYKLDFVAQGILRKERRSYAMQTRNVEVFFASPEDEARFIAEKNASDADLQALPR